MPPEDDALWAIREELIGEGRLPGAQMRAPLEQAQLDDIAWRMLRAGVQPTVESLRTVYGRGSPNRLHPMLRRFYAGLATRLQFAPLAEDVPAPLRQLWLQALDLAMDAVAAKHAAQAEDLRKREAELDRREAALALHLAEASAHAVAAEPSPPRKRESARRIGNERSPD
ncbi:DNA-binding protein [Lysobacter sp. CA199]|uniref:DNA-binding protein n=1 Tax=Lysobacter sp. CA199 TaxID=3455608 RepID=UPI003F8D8D28